MEPCTDPEAAPVQYPRQNTIRGASSAKMTGQISPSSPKKPPTPPAIPRSRRWRGDHYRVWLAFAIFLTKQHKDSLLPAHIIDYNHRSHRIGNQLQIQQRRTQQRTKQIETLQDRSNQNLVASNYSKLGTKGTRKRRTIVE